MWRRRNSINTLPERHRTDGITLWSAGARRAARHRLGSTPDLHEGNVQRRDFLISSAGAALAAALPAVARANVPAPYDWTAMPPMDDRQGFIDYMVKNRGEDPLYLGERFDRFQVMVRNKDLTDDKTKRAFLFTPREEFCLKANLARAYDNDFLDINFGVTISGPHLVGRMTQQLDVKKGEKVLEIGTGSGYQSAFLANLTDNVHTIEIIKPLQQRTDATYTDLTGRG
jgi:protein-L-isoaspartate(D-aspartate) O-methyltransferase